METYTQPVICQDQESFKKALHDSRVHIVVKSPLYDEIYESAKESQNGKIKKTIGTAALVAGTFVLPGISAWIAAGAGLAAVLDGRNKDSAKKYKIEIDELQKTITFKRK